MRHCCRLHLVLLFGFMSSAARAQDPLFELSLAELLELSISSASKSEETLREIPHSVTVVTRDDIALLGYDTFEELLINLPSVYHIDTYEDFAIGIRGIVGGSIAFLINGVQQHPTRVKGLSAPGRAQLNIPVDSIDRIEFVRGPSSVIYGTNAFLGSINIITNDADSSGGKGVSSYGNNGFSRAFLRAAKTFDDGQFLVNIGTYRTDGIGGNIDAVISTNRRAYLESTYPGYNRYLNNTLSHDDLSVDLSGRYKNFALGFRYSDMNYGFYPLVPAHREGTTLRLQHWIANASYDVALRENLESCISLVASQMDYHAETDFWPNDDEGYQDQGSIRYEFEGLLRATGEDRLHWLLGVNVRQLENIFSEIDLEITADGDVYQQQRTSTPVTSTAIFGNVSVPVTRKLTLIGGYRVSQTSAYEIAVSANLPAGSESTTDVMQMDDSAVKLASMYALNDRHSIKLSYSTASQDHRSAVYSEPEEIASGELNYLYVHNDWTASTSLFANRTDNLLRAYQEFTESTFRLSDTNDGEWLTLGAEFIANYRPTPRFFAEFSSVVQRTRDKATSEDIEIGNSPEWVAKIKTGYAYANWRVSGTLAYVDGMLADYRLELPDNNVWRYGAGVDGYLLLNANVRFKMPERHWYINFHGFNVTNENIRYPANELVNFYYGTYGPERRITLTIGFEL